MTDVLKKLTTIIMAGGKGERLFPLTRDKAKPVITFGSLYRIIDFTLSNCLNSGIRRIYVLSQYGSFSLDQHLRQAWDIMHPDLGEYIYSMPPQQIMVSRWYRGTADSIFQNLNLLEAERPEHVLILSGDHVYKMNYRKMLDFHLDRGADLTVAAALVPRVEGSSFGILKVNETGEVENFLEKPADPPGLPDNPDISLVSMGVYIFNAGVLVEEVIKDAKNKTSKHDFGGDIIPQMVGRKKVFAFNFQDPVSGAPSYWRDIGLLDAYFKAHQDLLGPAPTFELFDPEWPMRSRPQLLPPSKFITGGECRWRWRIPSSPRAASSKGPWPGRSSPPGCSWGRARWWKTPSSGTGWSSGPGPRSGGRLSKRGCGCRPGFPSATTPSGTPRGFTSPKTASWWCPTTRFGRGLKRMSSMAAAAKGSLTPTRLYLVRHGQVADGHTDRYHGNNDIGLSDKGVRQFEDLAAQLTGVDLAGVYASDLTRALTGAEIISRGREAPLQIIPEFREVHFGVWEGLSFTEIAERYPAELEARFRDLTSFRIPGGESLLDVSSRVLPRLNELIAQHFEKAFIIVAHAGVNRVILSEALGLSLDHLFRLDQNYGCLNVIDYFPDMAVVRLINGGVNGVAAG